jgi:hypothetical protein
VKMQENLHHSYTKQERAVNRSLFRSLLISMCLRAELHVTIPNASYSSSFHIISYSIWGGLALYPSLLSRYEGKREEKKFRAV